MARKKAEAKFTVVRDTREHAGKGWTFASSPVCSGTVVRKLDTGDYTVAGLESVLTIDRKGCVSEFAKNLFEKRFENELARMRSFAVAVVLLEFDFEEIMRWPQSSGIPAAKRRYVRLTRHALLARFWELQLEFPNVSFLFAGLYGKEAALSLFKRAVARYGFGAADSP